MMRTSRWLSSEAWVLLLFTTVPAAVAGPFDEQLGSGPVKLAGDVKLSLMNGDGAGDAGGRGSVPYLKALGAPPKR
jgi:hypothetical protein